MVKRIAVTLLVGACSFMGGLAGFFLLTRVGSPAYAQAGGRSGLGAPVNTDVPALGERFEAVARKVSPAVVAVEARKPSEKSVGGSRKIIEESGSGVIVRLDGKAGYFVLTNNHVVTGATPDKIIVFLADGRIFSPARVWGDADTDVAVLSLDVNAELPTATVGDSDRMPVGQWVLAIGSPFGLYQTVTHGIISARERGQINLGSTFRIKEFLQTDAAINPGSSGGPLVNLNAEVVGINTAIATTGSEHSGVAFSIPINLFTRIARELLDKGKVSRGWLGLQLTSSFEPTDALKVGLDRAWGAQVEYIYPGAPADKAGLRAGDVILEMDNLPIRNENQFINNVSALSPDKSVVLVIWRDRKRLNLTAIVGDWEKRPPVSGSK